MCNVNHFARTAWEISRNVLGCNEELVRTINRFVEAGSNRKHYCDDVKRS